MANEIVPVENYAIMQLSIEEIKEIISENLGGDTLSPSDLDKVVIPTGGLTTWTLPSPEGPIQSQEVNGMIAVWAEPRGYWEKEYTGDGTPPDCQSKDGRTGFMHPESTCGFNLGGDCEKCPMNQWGSKLDAKGNPTRGKACKQRRDLYMLLHNSYLPINMSGAPTSIKPVKKYFTRMASQGIRYSDAVTKLTLEKIVKPGVPPYSVIVPSMVSRLNPEQQAKVRAYSAHIKKIILSTPIKFSDFNSVDQDDLSTVE